jgi:predicted nuclease of predicted toxin-antitoxin system
MKLLLDECTPKRLRLDFPGHEVQTVEQAGLKGLKNGELLREASSRFEVLITVDQNVPFQQNITAHSIALLILVGRSNRYSELKMLAPKALHALHTIKAGDVVRIEHE